MGANSMLSADDMARARAAGLNPDRVTGFLERVRREVDEGLLPAVQVAVARDRQVALSATFGDAGADSMVSVFSATKAVTSSAAWLLMHDGLLDEGERVADIIPEFAGNGKDAVVVQQLFTHTAGFPHAPFRPLEWLDRDRRLQRFAQWRLMWEPGSRFEYHPTASMWVLAEIIERRSGMDFRDFIRRRVVEPLGLQDFYVGLPEHENHRVVPCVHVGEPATAEDYAKLGIPQPPATEVTEEAVLNFNRPEFRAVGVPGGGGIMSAAGTCVTRCSACWPTGRWVSSLPATKTGTCAASGAPTRRNRSATTVPAANSPGWIQPAGCRWAM